MVRFLATAAALVLVLSACSFDNTPEPVPPTSGPATTIPPATTTSAGPPPTAPQGDAAFLVEVTDGDSLVIEVGGDEEEVRLIGINSPEGGECFGDEAREALGGRLAGNEITLVADPQGDDRDRFGRLLRYAYLGDVQINVSMIRNGFALALGADHPFAAEFKSAEEEAVAAGVGMWSAGACGGPPVQQAIDIIEVEHDPPGRDEENLNGEWVEVRNDGELAAGVGGWVLRDESSTNRYTFPVGFELPPDGAVVRVRVGCGTDTADELFWCATEPVWNNGGDTAYLFDAHGSLVARLGYRP